MSHENTLAGRGKALEDSFFARKNHELAQRLKVEVAEEQARRELAGQLGLSAEAVAGITKAGVGTDAIAALGLVPLVAVAWADGKLSKKERAAVLSAVHHAGIDDQSVAHGLLASWLDSAPPAELMETWQHYMRALSTAMEPAQHRRMGEDLLRRTRRIAESTGGILGYGNKVNVDEEKMLAKLKEAFQALP